MVTQVLRLHGREFFDLNHLEDFMKFINRANLSLFIVSAFALTACDLKKKITVPEYDTNAEDAYFNDLMDSIGDDSAQDGSLDDSVRPHMAPEHLETMTANKFAHLDADKSGSISEEEFLTHDRRRKADDKTLTPEQKSLREARLKAEFAKFAGEDKSMSRDELKALLEKEGLRVSGHRRRHREAEAHRSASSSDDSSHPEDSGRRGSSSGNSHERDVEREKKRENSGRND